VTEEALGHPQGVLETKRTARRGRAITIPKNNTPKGKGKRHASKRGQRGLSTKKGQDSICKIDGTGWCR